jgi:Cro/C1-type helix-turn-helix DNA-binding protein
MPPDIKNFRELVAWLVREHHHGVWYEMAKKLQVSSGLVYQWRDGTVKRPSDENIDAICKAYRLDYWKLMGIITGRKPPSAAMWLAAVFLPALLGLAISGGFSPVKAQAIDFIKSSCVLSAVRRARYRLAFAS